MALIPGDESTEMPLTGAASADILRRNLHARRLP
jgi:hypothetical protein